MPCQKAPWSPAPEIGLIMLTLSFVSHDLERTNTKVLLTSG
jgi:hypothetical protein